MTSDAAPSAGRAQDGSRLAWFVEALRAELARTGVSGRPTRRRGRLLADYSTRAS